MLHFAKKGLRPFATETLSQSASETSLTPGEPTSPEVAVMVSALNAQLTHHGATDVLRAAFEAVPDIALVSSFGAESVVLLHLAAMVKRDVPVIFIDTEMLFAETLVYQQDVAERLRLENVTVIRADNLAQQDPGRHLASARHGCVLRAAQDGAAAKGVGPLQRMDDRPETVSIRNARHARIL